MPPKKKVAKRKTSTRRRPVFMRGEGPRYTVHPQLGEGFFDSIGNFFKGAYDGVKKGVNFLRDSKIISGVSGMIGDPRAQAVSRISGQLGFGQPDIRSHMRTMGGRGGIPNVVQTTF